MSFVSRNLQCGLAAIALRLYISTEFEQQAHGLQPPECRGPVQRGTAFFILQIYICTMVMQ
jgi:hypothetical protein